MTIAARSPRFVIPLPTACLSLAVLTASCSSDRGGAGLSSAVPTATSESAIAAAGWSAQLVSISGLPATVVPGAAYLVAVTVRNNGNIAWGPSERLVSRTSPRSLWGWSLTWVTGAVAPGDTHTFNFRVVAPAGAGAAAFSATMHHDGPTVTQGIFGDSGPNGTTGDTTPIVTTPVTLDAGSTPELGASEVAHNFGGPYAEGTILQTITVTMQNSGSQAWAGSSYALRNRTAAVAGPAFSRLGAAETIAPAASRTFTMKINAPPPGDHTLSFQMWHDARGYFGPVVTGMVHVDAATPVCGNNVVEGFERCDDGNVANGDGCSAVCVYEHHCGNSIVEPGESCDDGNSAAQDGCVGCLLEGSPGNGMVEAGEQCDDGNLANGDGCSSVMTCEGGTVLTFEGVSNMASVGDYYNGGAGPNYGVSFSNLGLALIDSDAGGGGNFGGEPSPSTILFFLGGGSTVMNVAAGFSGGFSVYYSAINSPGMLTVYDGLNATGNVLVSLFLPITASNGGDPTGVFSPFFPVGVTFPGVARSVDFAGVADQIGLDDVRIGACEAP